MLRALLPEGTDGRAIIGDLHEEFRQIVRSKGALRARLWYWRQVLGTGISYARPGRSTLDRRLQDVRFALRGMARERGFATTVVVTLALGIGAGTAIFSVVDGVLLRPLPFHEPDRLVRVWASNNRAGQPYLDLLYSDIDAFTEGVPSFQSVTGLSLVPRIMMDARGDNAENVLVARTTPALFGTLGIDPVLGRAYTDVDARRGEQIALISHGLWERRFAGDPDVIGTFVHLDVRGYQIVGVMPEGLEYPERVHVWRPLFPDETDDNDREVHLLARLGSDVSLSVANAEVVSVAAGLAETDPADHANIGAWIQPLQATVVRDVRTALYALLGAVGLVLLITCVNTANLLLARSARRSHEVAVRTALGASRGRIIALHLTESLLLAAFGGIGGLLVGRWLLSFMLSVSPELPRLDTVSLDMRVVLVMAVVTGVAGILFGVGPALHAANTPPERTLREGGQATTRSGGRIRLQSGLVTTEIALSTVLAVLALLLFSTFRSAITYDRGFEFDNLVSINVDPMHPPQAGDELRAYFGAILEGVQRIPGVHDAALSSHEITEQRGFRGPVAVEGMPEITPAPQATGRIVSESFFRTAGVPLRLGRWFSTDGGAEDIVDLIVNERFVRRHMTGIPDPLGRRVSLDWAEGRIVGVVADISPDLGEPAEPMVYVPFERMTMAGMWLTVRTIDKPATVVPAVRREVEAVDPNVLLERVTVLEQSVRTSVAPQRFNMLFVISFAVLALALAAIGIYGVTSFSVATRRGEIGIRRALGASDHRVALEVARRVGMLTVLGVVVGLVGAAAGGRLLASLLVGVSPTDPLILASVAALLGTVAAASALIPIVRAIRIDPTETLRGD